MAAQSDNGAIKVELFRDDDGRICGWFLGPVRISPAGVTIPYLPRSKTTAASVAVVRAVQEADGAGLPICIIDPYDLWDRAWHG